MAGRLVGANPIIAVDVNPERLALALELGATHTLNATEGDVVARVKEVVPRGARFAFDTSGVESSWKAAAQCLGMGGTFGNVAVPVDGHRWTSDIEMLSKGARFQFILAGSSTPRVILPQLIQWYKQGRFPFDRLVKRFDFRRHQPGFRGIRRRTGDQAGVADALGRSRATGGGRRHASAVCAMVMGVPTDAKGAQSASPGPAGAI